MKHNYTENKLIQLIYGECDIFDRLEIEDALDNNVYLKEEYDALNTAYRQLPKVTFAPLDKTIDSILSYSSNKIPTAIC